jgi:hypothetical protein
MEELFVDHLCWAPQVEKIERELCAAANSIHLVRQTMNQGASMRALVKVLDWGGAPENRLVNAPEDSEGGAEEGGGEAPIDSGSKEEGEMTSGENGKNAKNEDGNMEVEGEQETTGGGSEKGGLVSEEKAGGQDGNAAGTEVEMSEDPAAIEERDRELARSLMREENAAVREEQMRERQVAGKRKRDVSGRGREGRRRKESRRGEEDSEEGEGNAVEFRITVESVSEDETRTFLKAYVEDRRYDVEDWLTSELMGTEQKREAFLKVRGELFWFPPFCLEDFFVLLVGRLRSSAFVTLHVFVGFRRAAPNPTIHSGPVT